MTIRTVEPTGKPRIRMTNHSAKEWRKHRLTLRGQEKSRVLR